MIDKEAGSVPASRTSATRVVVKELGFFKIKLRHDIKRELLRTAFQACVLATLAFLAWDFVSSIVLGEWPTRTPFRVWEDTFGPFEDFLALKPALLERSRFESGRNMWRHVLFSSHGWLGYLQDVYFSVWNWHQVAIYFGPAQHRLLAMVDIAFIAYVCLMTAPALASHSALAFRYQWFPFAVAWCRNMPENFLILEQLTMARDVFARRLSEESNAAVDEAMELEPLVLGFEGMKEFFSGICEDFKTSRWACLKIATDGLSVPSKGHAKNSEYDPGPRTD